MITDDGWFDWAIRDPGPMEKTNAGVNGGRGMIPHSAEGYWPYLQTLLHSLTRRASWGASNLADGRFFQHYPITVRTWTSGAGFPNNNFFAFENEGIAGEPLTQPQIDNIIRAGRELMALQGWKPERPLSEVDLDASLYEHTECTRWGAESTSCPSGRIPWNIIVPALQEEGMTDAEKAEFEAMKVTIKSLQGIAWDQGVRLNALDTHVHETAASKTSPPVQP